LSTNWLTIAVVYHFPPTAHIWSSRLTSLERPDWCILDLDPKSASFAHVLKIANAIRSLCKTIQLPCFLKTSGATGLHVLIPLDQQYTYEQSRSLGELLANVIVRDLPEIATVNRRVAEREGRVYVDYLQNGHGRLLVAPSVCARYQVGPCPCPSNGLRREKGWTRPQVHHQSGGEAHALLESGSATRSAHSQT
jgi:DNA primase